MRGYLFRTDFSGRTAKKRLNMATNALDSHVLILIKLTVNICLRIYFVTRHANPVSQKLANFRGFSSFTRISF